MDYIIKFCYVDSSRIDNTIEPNEERIIKLNKANQFFIRLRESILKEGIRNPTVLTAKEDGITSRYGGSRILIAQELGIKVPAIIADFDNIFPDAEVLKNTDDIKAKFIDKPAHIRAKPYGINVSGCKNVHLEDK